MASDSILYRRNSVLYLVNATVSYKKTLVHLSDVSLALFYGIFLQGEAASSYVKLLIDLSDSLPVLAHAITHFC